MVGVLCGRSPAERYSAHHGYLSSITAAGGVPVLLPAGPDVLPEVLAELVDHCAAIVVTGGGDVDPGLYGGSGSAERLMDVDPARDSSEMAVARRAADQGKRVLGICRGAQVLAVMCGGTLIHDLVEKGFDGHWEEERQYEPVHAIRAEPGSVAASLLDSVDRVNSIHHQAIADPGHLLRATAWSHDDVIEAVEAPGLLGLQWHPERLSGSDPRHLAPFAWVAGR
jgi:putative glutamine amidotransferase